MEVMNVYGSSASTAPGIPVPCELYENYICEPLAEIARQSGASVSRVRDLVREMNVDGRGYLTLFQRFNDGVEMVCGYIFEDI